MGDEGGGKEEGGKRAGGRGARKVGGGRVEGRNKQESVNVYTLGYPFLASSQELLVEQSTNQQLLSSEVKAKKDET